MAALSFPGSPTDGQVFDTFIYNATKGVWQRSEWANASGGTETSYTLADGTNWIAHTFTTSGTLTVNKTGYLDMLVVGTGAGASERYGIWANGGAGGVRHGIQKLTVAGNYTIAVGAPSSITDPNNSKVLVVGPGEGARAWNGTYNNTRNGHGGGGGAGGISENSGTTNGGGAGGEYWGPTASKHDGIELDYSGSVYQYGRGGVYAEDYQLYGKGGNRSGAGTYNNAGPGIVIVRYQV